MQHFGVELFEDLFSVKAYLLLLQASARLKLSLPQYEEVILLCYLSVRILFGLLSLWSWFYLSQACLGYRGSPHSSQSLQRGVWSPLAVSSKR
ncbi:hypothetical protein F2Q69_00002981 [Brassica cretica]|uniref:Uncharacterized protein n=1 Tax=Brassica cretica TaxID=69181 RepID=A0A8S9NVY4_BRACR|nr:hypothetical protein F2Q69_00002981 [Brassica cretica]